MRDDIKLYVERKLTDIKDLNGTELNNYMFDLVDEIAYSDEIELEESLTVDLSGNSKLEILEALYNEMTDEIDKKALLDSIINKETELGSDIVNVFKQYLPEEPETDLEEPDEEELEEELEEEEELENENPTSTNSDEEEQEKEEDEEKEQEIDPFEKEGDAITQYKKDTEELRKKIEELENTNPELNSKLIELKELEKTLSELEQEYELKKDSEEIDLTELENIINKTKERISELKEELNVGTKDLEEIKKENLYNESFNDALPIEIYEKELQETQAKKTSLEKFQQTIKQEIDNLTKEIELLTEKLNGVTDLGSRATIRFEIASKTKKLEEYQSKNELINEELAKFDDKINSLTEIINNKDNNEFIFNHITEYLKTELEKNKTENEELESKKPEIISEIEQLKVNIENLEKEIAQMESMLNVNIEGMLPENITNLQNNLRNKKLELQLEKNKLASLEKELAGLEQNIIENNEIINGYEQEIHNRELYINFVNKINQLLDKNEISQEEIDSLNNDILSSDIDEDLKSDLTNKLQNTLNHIKTGKDNELESLKEELKNREANIALYESALNDIKELAEEVKNGKDPESEEIQNKKNAIKTKISPLPIELKKELEEYLELALTQKPQNVKNNKEKLEKIISFIVGFGVGATAIGIASIGLGGAIAIAAGAEVLNFAHFGYKVYKKRKKEKEELEKESETPEVEDEIEITEEENEIDKENKVTQIEKAKTELKRLAEDWKTLMKEDEWFRRITWGVHGFAVGAITAGMVNTIKANMPKPSEPQPIDPQPKQPDIKVGESADNLDLSKGYDRADWAAKDINSEPLNQGIMQDGNSVVERIVEMGDNGQILREGSSYQELIKAGANPDNVVFDIAKNTGGSRAWIPGRGL